MRLDLLNCYPHWEHPSYDLKQLFELSYLRRGLSLAPLPEIHQDPEFPDADQNEATAVWC